MVKYAIKPEKITNLRLGMISTLLRKKNSLEDDTGKSEDNPRFYGLFTIHKMISEVTEKLRLSTPTKSKGMHDAFYVCLRRPCVKYTLKQYPGKIPIHFADRNEE